MKDSVICLAGGAFHCEPSLPENRGLIDSTHTQTKHGKVYICQFTLDSQERLLM